ncbi:alpha/beta hydrolase [Arthrobacter sp. ok362]|uniref:alpha/beta hydrolase n=1 Tax=Arthrobacter sp. ok362 TaxID=1761745 RepID=UPI000886B2FE|nr:alpha/beta hydrolase [Arthrobacter sp. ok362]SDK47967.1 Pimeloyl-ACP methyl ester carboxylesterase [Arthrobacter sp. ok362]
MNQQTEVVIAHGLWHQPAHFDQLVAELSRLGVNVHVPRLHRGSLAADTAAVQKTVDGCLRPPVVLGHSYGGSVITGLERIRHLLYVAAFVPAADESSALLGGPAALVNDAIRHNDDGSTSIQTDRAHEVLYADCSPDDSSWATSLLVPQQPGHGRGVPSHIAWKTTESTYIHCEQDRALSPALQERMAARCTKVFSLNSSHSPFISQPGRLTRLIMEIRASLPKPGGVGLNTDR